MRRRPCAERGETPATSANPPRTTERSEGRFPAAARRSRTSPSPWRGGRWRRRRRRRRRRRTAARTPTTSATMTTRWRRPSRARFRAAAAASNGRRSRRRRRAGGATAESRRGSPSASARRTSARSARSDARASRARVDHAAAQRADRELQARPQDRDRGAARGHGAGQGGVVRRRGQDGADVSTTNNRTAIEDAAAIIERSRAIARLPARVSVPRFNAAMARGAPRGAAGRRRPPPRSIMGHRARARDLTAREPTRAAARTRNDTREVRQPAKRLGRAGGVRADGSRRHEGAEGCGERNAPCGRAQRREGGPRSRPGVVRVPEFFE